MVRQTVSERGSQTCPTIDGLKHVVIGSLSFSLIFQNVLSDRGVVSGLSDETARICIVLIPLPGSHWRYGWRFCHEAHRC